MGVREFGPLRGRATLVLGWLVGWRPGGTAHVDLVPTTSAAVFAGHDWEGQACERA